MLNKPSDTNIIQGQFKDLNLLLLKAIENLSYAETIQPVKAADSGVTKSYVYCE